MRLTSKQLFSDFLPQSLGQNVLLVGAERSDEFADAMRLVRQGHKVVVVNRMRALLHVVSPKTEEHLSLRRSNASP
jgi:hypothetical protein